MWLSSRVTSFERTPHDPSGSNSIPAGQTQRSPGQITGPQGPSTLKNRKGPPTWRRKFEEKQERIRNRQRSSSPIERDIPQITRPLPKRPRPQPPGSKEAPIELGSLPARPQSAIRKRTRGAQPSPVSKRPATDTLRKVAKRAVKEYGLEKSNLGFVDLVALGSHSQSTPVSGLVPALVPAFLTSPLSPDTSAHVSAHVSAHTSSDAGSGSGSDSSSDTSSDTASDTASGSSHCSPPAPSLSGTASKSGSESGSQSSSYA